MLKTNDDFLRELSIAQPNLSALDKYNGALTKIRFKCDICGNIWATTPNAVLRCESHCPICHGVPIDYNNPDCFSNSFPEFADCLAVKQDGYIFKKMSSRKVDWICPNCGELVKQIPISKVSERKHIPCKRCSDGVSYPNKFMHSMLSQLGVEFETEYSPDWIKPKRFDFYVPSFNLIIEMDGALGHGGKTMDGRTDLDTLGIDAYKDACAINNGLSVIRIDSKLSDVDYLSNNILSSQLSTIFDLSNISWKKCGIDAYSSLKIKTCNKYNDGESTIEIANSLHISRITVIKYLKDAAKSGLCSYDPKAEMMKSGYRNIVKTFGTHSMSVQCLDTGEVFQSIREANAWLGYAETSHTISDYLRGKLQSAGRHPITKQKLHWRLISKGVGNALCHESGT